MDEEIYSIEQVPLNSGNAKENNLIIEEKVQRAKDVKLDDKRNRDMKLVALEEQLSRAENRCSTLRTQVKLMKTLCNGEGKPIRTKTAGKMPENCGFLTGKKRKHELSDSQTEDECKEDVPSHDVQGDSVPATQCADSNATVQTINNIFTGITNSVHRLTELHASMGDARNVGAVRNMVLRVKNKRLPNEATNDTLARQAPEKPYQIDLPPTVNAHPFKSKKRRRARFPDPQPPKQSSSVRFSTVSVGGTSGVISKRRQSLFTKITSKRPRVQSAADLQAAIEKHRKRFMPKIKKSRPRLLTTKKSYEGSRHGDKLVELFHNSAARMATFSEEEFTNIKNPQVPRMPAPIQECYETPRNDLMTARNYEVPTIASKLKQVAHVFRNFNFRVIPFVAAQSTTPSHNLGVNIQQVLSIIKGRKPITDISPTLAHNIELAATKLGSRPLSALVSSIGSRYLAARQEAACCPLTRRHCRLNYGRLQEQARDIPEEPTDLEADSPRRPEVQKENRGVEWKMHQKNKECTCAQQRGQNFSYVCSKYLSENRKCMPPYNSEYKSGPGLIARKVSTKVIRNEPGNKLSQTNSAVFKEKMLKETMRNLHDEFKQLTERYDDLKKTVMGGMSSDTVVKELEDLEKHLQNKENEITMVMLLYKEGQSLKQQVRTLKKRASLCSVASAPDYRDGKAVGHLTKLLRQVQQLQDVIKTKH